MPDLLFDGEDALAVRIPAVDVDVDVCLLRVRVFPPIDAYPQKHARAGHNPRGDLAGQELLTSVTDVVSSPCVFLANIHQPVQIPAVTPRLVQHLEEEDLAETGGVLCADFLRALEPLDDLVRGRDPAAAGTWRDDLAEGVEAEDAAVGVEGEVGGDERMQEGFVRGRLGGWRRCGREGAVGLHLEEVVGLVFDDVDVMFLRHGVDLFASLERLRGARGVLARWNGVEEPGLLDAVARGGIPG